MIEIKKVDVECIDVFWDDVKNWIQNATDQSNGRHTIVSTYRLLKEEQMTMFLILKKKIIKGAYVVTKVIYPNINVLCILFWGGSEIINNLTKIEDFFIQYAKNINCSGLEIIGRKGWVKAFKNAKTKTKHTGFFYEMAT